MDNQTRRILLERVKASGFPGSILDVFQNPAILDQFIAEQQQSQLQQPQNQPVVAQTPQEQEQGLRPAHAAGNVGQSMIFPNVEPNQSFNTVGMKIPIDINKVDNQGNLVESYKAVPPGIQDLPTGPNRGMVIESPAEGYAKTGGVRKYQTAGPVKTVESYRSPWWDPSDPTKWNKAWTIDPERQRTQAEFPNGYTLPTIDIVGEKSKNFETSNKKISTEPTYIFPPADRSEEKYYEFLEEVNNMKFDNINFGKDTIINITNTPMGWFGFNTIPGETYTSILGNNYIEKADNNTGKPEDTAVNWKTRIKDSNDTFRNADGAKHSGSYYHSKDIPAFYGIENKRFKVGKPEDFNENTVIVPIRNSTVPYAKVDIERGLFNRDQLYTYDASGDKIWNLSKKDKFLVHSPSTGQTIFLSNSQQKESGKFMKTALEKFKEGNPDAYIISIDEGRFGPNLHSSEGLPENTYKFWNKLNDRSHRRILYPFIVGDTTDEYYPIDSDSNPNDFGYNIGILKQKTGGVRTYLKGGLKNRVLYNKARYKR